MPATRLKKSAIAALVAATVAEIARPRRIGVPGARTVRKRLSAALKTTDPVSVVAVGLAIAQTPAMKAARARWVGWELINEHVGALDSLDIDMIETLGAGNSSWDEVDGYGINILGAAWQLRRVTDADIHRWANDSDLWRRRAALVATVVLNLKSRGGRGDTRRTLGVARLLVDDREDMVVKALSWALRALVVWDRTAVENFLLRNDARLAARVKRETRTKLVTGTKNKSKKRA